MAEKNWSKIGAGAGFLGIIIAVLIGVGVVNLDEPTRYFIVSCDLIFGVFVYFQYFKGN